MTTESLFAECILPGCTQPVAEELTPCQTCRTIFGPMLQKTDSREPLTHADITARDNDTRAAYRAQLRIIAETPQPARRRNQRCWMCEQRRTCTQTPQGWECRDCIEIT
ncbi:hypothetical protein [Rhodococcus phenolicus]|uniref:hypothetical protein n=1 Tax=Rhodococcus phenolicus TaxID=263849 RepID=UPI00082A3AD5|nr:hypothetical protein [Rhodococcus phenolicus]